MVSTHTLGSQTMPGLICPCFCPSVMFLDGLKALDYRLRRDPADTQLVHYHLGMWQTLKHHIIPCFVTFRSVETIVFRCVRLFARLTMKVRRTVCGECHLETHTRACFRAAATSNKHTSNAHSLTWLIHFFSKHIHILPFVPPLSTDRF